MTWKYELAGQLCHYEESLSSPLWSCTLAVVKLVQQIKEKKICLFPNLYGPVSHLLGVSMPLHRREELVGTHHVPPCGFTCVTKGRTQRSGIENIPRPL